ncbi:GNAT family N-acetyltransferase [Aliikangiella marina]|uniref:GNAT family N-acetyltransferase n=1 Tax=Aliikangiella marina TaxID=1712262 RepID=A0A545TJX3_9GAMM|nr:GNAT family N-acetyltransferase [Aliikangiella marina]TQV77523.1 GNAT family N-acetyltransferase [Aliikangiella marina]
MTNELRFFDQIIQIPKEDWQRLIATDYPFLQYDYLLALESSKSVGQQTGWQVNHCALINQGQFLAVMPGYLKTHSYGEYVFDFQWANAFHSAGFEYYPKLITAIPFTPASGPRIGIDSSVDLEVFIRSLNEHLISIYRNQSISSFHMLFPTQTLSRVMASHNMFSRSGVQYHWLNDGYADFNDFLAKCKIKKRKNIKRERRCIAENNLQVKVLKKDQLTEDIWRRFYFMYQLTYMKRSGHGGYLTEDFFTSLSQSNELNVMLIAAFQNNEMIAASLFFYDAKNLYGRYWGCVKEFEFLHFELCYYQGIEFAIKHLIDKFDAGAQGDHKVARGFYPVKTYSNHWIGNPKFRQAIYQYVSQEEKIVDNVIQETCLSLPYKNIESAMKA